MSTKIYDENFQEIIDKEQMSSYGSFILPDLQFMNFSRDIKILWYEHLKDVAFSTDESHENIQPIDIKKIDNSDIDVVIVLWSDHPWQINNTHLQELTKCKKPCIILSWTDEIPDFDHVLFFPFWPITYPIGRGVRIPPESTVLNNDRTYLFSCLNGRHQFDRFVNLVSMRQHPQIFDEAKSIVTCPLTDHSRNNEIIDSNRIFNELDLIWPAGSTIFRDQVLPSLPITHPAMPEISLGSPNSFDDSLSASVPAYTDTYVNIIAETCQYSKFISEKSLKPMLAGQLFVTIAVPGTLQKLRNVGLDIFDDIIEHDRYSEYPDVHVRVRALHDYLEKIAHWDWKKIYIDTAERRLYNRNRLITGSIKSAMFKYLENMINECI